MNSQQQQTKCDNCGRMVDEDILWLDPEGGIVGCDECLGEPEPRQSRQAEY